MPRPSKPIKRRASGIYFVQLRDENGTRHTLSLDSKDVFKATARASEGLARLQEQIRASTPQRPVWRADEEFTTYPFLDEEGKPDEHRPVVERAVNVGHQSQVRQMSWQDLIREAEAKFRRINGKPYSASWHNNAKAAIAACPSDNPLLLTPQLLNEWVKQQQLEGVAPLTISARCSCLSGLITNSIKSGLLVGHTNPFSLVDYSTRVVQHHETALIDDYKKWFKASLQERAIPDETQVLYIDLLVYSGARNQEIKLLQREDVDFENGTIRIGVKLRDEKDKRIVPIPFHLIERLKAHHFRWASNTTINKRIKENVSDRLSAHSLRHGLKRLTRDAHIDSRLAEFYLGHSLPSLEATYGDGFSTQSMREAMSKVWGKLDRMRKDFIN